MPSFVATPAPLSEAVDAIERGVARRAARVWAPRFVGGALAFRGVLQPVSEWRVKASKRLPQALVLADPAPGDPQLSERAAKLGVSAQHTDVPEAPSPIGL
jgi:hypothetical protein